MHSAAGKEFQCSKEVYLLFDLNPTEHATEYGVRISIYHSETFLKCSLPFFNVFLFFFNLHTFSW